MSTVKIESSRYEVLKDEFEQQYFLDLKKFLVEEKNKGEIIYPSWSEIFKAFELSPFNKVKVVILWQDPYHGEWQAMWLSFSVPQNVKKPPSLVNIYQEIANEYPDYDTTQSWDLTRRATQWVLLLNTILTVRANQAASHREIGREKFTDSIIKKISDLNQWVVFLLRWNFAISKKNLIDTNKHLILTTVHPSPLSSYRGWFGCNHFKLANEYL